MDESSIRRLASNRVTGSIYILGGGVVGRSIADKFIQSGQSVVVIDEEESVCSSFPVGVCPKDSLWLEKLKKKYPPKFFVSSPGVSPQNEIYKQIVEDNIPEICELDLAISFIGQPLVAVTGTNGKTTITRLVSHFCNVVAIGNIGDALFSKVDSTYLEKGESCRIRYVAELSSYQLAKSKLIKPNVAIISNISADHLKWHETLNNYVLAKLNIVKNLDQSSLVVVGTNSDIEFDLNTKAKIVSPSFDEINNCLEVKTGLESSVKLERLPLAGEHNYENISIAAIASSFISNNQIDFVKKIQTYRPLDYRLSKYKRSYQGCNFYNDSKSTNPHSTLSAIKSLHSSYNKFYLLIGGENKFDGADLYTYWRSVIKLLRNSNKDYFIYLFGDVAEDLNKIFENHSKLKLKVYKNLSDCMSSLCSDITLSDDSAVIFSPGCSSFDEFKNYIQRGQFFDQELKRLLFNDI